MTSMANTTGSANTEMDCMVMVLDSVLYVITLVHL